MTTPTESAAWSGRLARSGILALFFLSGVSGLVYEVAWERQLVVVFGNTMLATSTILSAFMAGLAAGSYVFGRYADREGTKLLRTYALLEAGIGGFALIFPLLLSLATPVYTGLYRLLGGNLLGVNLVRFAICLCLVSVPTFLMGGALPVLAKLCGRRSGSLGRDVGVLYGLNTLGGFAGCLASGFVLLPALGISRAIHIAVAINLAVAAVAWVMAKTDREEAAPEGAVPPGTQGEHSRQEEYGPSTRAVVKAGILISGFCALAYEVFWSRMLSMVLGSSMYSFTLTVSTFLAGIALGSVIYARFLARISRQTTVFIVVEFAIGVAAYLTPYTLLLAPRGATTGLLALLRSTALMAGPAVLMGAALPCAVSICRRGEARAGSSVGDVYAMNTVGSVVGPLAAGFVLIPVAGMQKGLLLVAGLNMLAGVMVFASRRMSRARRAACAAALVSLLAVTAILGPTMLFRHLYDRNEPGADVILYEEGTVANVVVYDFHRAGYRDLFLNGSEEASTRLWHIQLFRMLGALPAVVHGDPDDAVMIAFGAGMSAGACVDLVNGLECVELNPDIHEVAEIFARENLKVLRNPRLKVIVNDGRNHLLLAGKRYSLVMSDATNPVSFDAWTLYTREFYRLCKDRLEPGGVFCQWIPTHLPGDAVKTILKTFVSVFPHASVWSVYGSTQCLMLATPERLDIDYAKLRDSLPPVLEASGLAGCGVDTPEKFLSFFLVGEDGLKALLAGHEEVNTDDLPRTQFMSGRDEEGTYSALELLRHQESIAPYVSNVGAEGERLRSRLRAYASLSRMLNLGFICADDFEFSKAAVLASEAGLADDENLKNVLGCDRKRREYFVERIAGHPDDASAHRAMGFIHWKEGDHEKAVRELTRAIAIRSEFADAHLLLALVYIDMQMPDRATGKLLELKELNPTHATLELLPKAFRVVHVLRKLKYQPDDPRLNASLAEAYAEFGWLEKAHGTVRLALERSPEDIGMLGRLAGMYETTDLVDKALDAYRRLSVQLPGNRDVAARIEKLADAVRTDDGWRRWVAARHPSRDDRARERDDADYRRAIRTWNEYEVEGRISKGTLRRAAKGVAAIVAAGTEEAHVCEDAAVLHEILGRYDDAVSFWRECRKLSPPGRDARNDRAGNNIERLELLVRLRDAPPPKQERAGTHNQIGTLYWKNGDVETAIRSFEKALEEDPRHVIALANIGMCYIATGRYEAAIEPLTRGLALAQDERYAAEVRVRLRWLKNVMGRDSP